MYYLWHIAMGGWFTNGGFYSTQLSKAAIFLPKDAFEIASKHVTNGELGAIVVGFDDVKKVLTDSTVVNEARAK